MEEMVATEQPLLLQDHLLYMPEVAEDRHGAQGQYLLEEQEEVEREESSRRHKLALQEQLTPVEVEVEG
jgi:hypothetical protein